MMKKITCEQNDIYELMATTEVEKISPFIRITNKGFATPDLSETDLDPREYDEILDDPKNLIVETIYDDNDNVSRAYFYWRGNKYQFSVKKFANLMVKKCKALKSFTDFTTDENVYTYVKTCLVATTLKAGLLLNELDDIAPESMFPLHISDDRVDIIQDNGVTWQASETDSNHTYATTPTETRIYNVDPIMIPMISALV